jgi:hypothetical protein
MNDMCDKTTDVNHRANDKMYTFKKHSMDWEEITKDRNEAEINGGGCKDAN